jgi:hypothetical protein
MTTAKLVTFDAKGAETERGLVNDEIVEIHYDHDETRRVVFEVEAPPVVSRPHSLRVNLNDGVSILFDSRDDAVEWLTQIRDAINEAVEMRDKRRAKAVV